MYSVFENRKGVNRMQTVLGIFRERVDANEALDTLHDKKFEAEQISIITKDDSVYHTSEGDRVDNVAEGTASGIATGGALGALAGLLIGIGALTIPGVGAVLIGGPLAAALGLTGAAATTVSGAVTGALAGGLVGALVGLGLPEHEAMEYEEEIRQGAVLLAINVHNRDVDLVEEILKSNGADKVRSLEVSSRQHVTM